MAEKGHSLPEASDSVVRSWRTEEPAAADTRVVDAQDSTGADHARPGKPDGEGNAILWKDQLAEHKGRLAIGVAAMLGAAIYYKWRETQLARIEPEEYARLQRLKDSIRERELHLARDADEDLPRGEEGL